MKRKTTVVGPAVMGITILFNATGIYAASNEYSHELSLGTMNYESSKDIDGISWDNQGIGFGYTYFFKPVINKKYPIAEAAFVTRVPAISVDYSTFDLELKQNGTTLLEGDNDQLGLEYTHRSNSYPVLLQIGETHGKTDYGYPSLPDYSLEEKSNSIKIFAGYYIQEAMALGIGYERSESEINYSFPIDFENSTFDWNEIALEYKYVALFDQGQALNFMLSYAKRDYDTYNKDDGNESFTSKEIEARLTYYFNRMIGLELAVNDISGDKDWIGGRSATITGNIYADNNLSFLIAYREFNQDDAVDGDSETFWANANYKF